VNPRATYRLQLRGGVTLSTAAELAGYLDRLGVSHLYTSPSQTAAPDSTHGYDVADPTEVDSQIGGEAGHVELTQALTDVGLGRLIDIVPNHLAAHPANPWWASVLEQGELSEWASTFDVDWEEGGGRIANDPARPNYRRFFDISGLVGVRVEDPEVLDRTHRLALGWVERGEVDGLRIDHPDGLRHPAEYFADLRARSGGTWTVIEKILAPHEELPDSWQVDGTTGYEFCRRVTGVLIDPTGEGPLTELYEELTGADPGWGRVAERAKRDVLAGSLSPDLERLARRTAAATASDVDSVRRELTDRLATFSVYRDYPPPDAPDHELRFAQLCAAATAKGVEDTAFYRYTRFCALNEVGSEPGTWGCSVEEFHEANRMTLARWPLSLTATATHDTKWGEDVRARMALLSEMPDQWAMVARRWMADSRLATLEPFTAYALLQAVVGAWPLPVERATQYLSKAMREAKSRTSWMEPDEEYERASLAGVEELLGDPAFAADLSAFCRPLAAWGRVNSLSQLALKLASPGVPDIYQGTELWDDSLVDPDNRRPVDFDLRRKRLADLGGGGPMDGLEEGLPKLRLTAAGLALRARRPDTFGAGSAYDELETTGGGRDHAVAFSRGEALVVAPRLLRRAPGAVPDALVVLPVGKWADVITGKIHSGGVSVPLADLWGAFPVALLERTGS
jgi:(1->4)-alpha-D-glucan 1-alpha-D-glucosylmutase